MFVMETSNLFLWDVILSVSKLEKVANEGLAIR